MRIFLRLLCYTWLVAQSLGWLYILFLVKVNRAATINEPNQFILYVEIMALALAAVLGAAMFIEEYRARLRRK